MKKLLVVLLGLVSLTSSAQITNLNATIRIPNPPSVPDFTRPEQRGTARWQTEGPGNFGFPTPLSTSTNADIKDRYIRFVVTDIVDVNAAGIQYNWTNSNSVDPCFDCEFNAAIDAGGKVGFGIHFQCGFCSGHGPNLLDPANGQTGYLIYPKSWHNMMQADGVKDYTWNNHGAWEWAPNMNGSTFQNTLFRPMWVAVLNHVNTTSHVSALTGKTVFYKDVINYIDISGYGQTGEWTNTPYGGASGNAGTWPGPAGTEPTVATLDSLIAIIGNVMREHRLVAQIATFDCNYLAQNTHNPPAVGWFALQYTNNAGFVGYRDDGWGNESEYINHWTIANPNTFTIPAGFPQAGQTFRFDTCLQNRYKLAPIVGEPCCATDATFSGLLNNQVPQHHITVMDNGNSFDYGNASNPSLYEPNMRASVAKMGYRLGYATGSMTTTLVPNGGFNITINWQNTGVAPPYGKWVPVFQLRNTSTNAVVWTGTSAFNAYLFLPGSPVAKSDNFTLTGVSAGTYNLYMAMTDPAAYYAPMALGITTAQGSDGFYLVRASVPVSGSLPNGPTAVINGPSAINLPTSSIVLDGTSSTDVGSTITAYLWSTVSGPNTPTIASPTASSTSITGLIAGTYVFSLKVTDGNALTNTTTQTVVVNAAPSGVTIFTNQVPTSVTDNDIPGSNPTTGQEVGVRFRSTIPGYIKGVRFFRTSGLNGTKTGELYTNTGTRLNSVVFTGETATGWQQQLFSVPSPIQANTNYVAAYFSNAGFYTLQLDYFLGASVTNGPLTAVADGTAAPHNQDPDLTFSGNGPYKYTSTAAFPQSAFRSGNYWVDVVFAANTPPTAVITGGANVQLPASSISLSGAASTDPEGNATITGFQWAQVSGPSTATIATPTASASLFSSLVAGTYVFQLTVTDELGATGSVTQSIQVLPAPDGTIFGVTAPPQGTSNDGSGAIELGTKFRTNANGFITALRFYKTAGNAGTHTGELYSSTGTLLAQVNYTGESASGWQTVTLTSPVAVTANTTYITTYWSSLGNYVGTPLGLQSAVVNGPVTALADGTDGNNGIFRYTAVPAVPNTAANKTNYWVDIQFQATAPPQANAGPDQVITLPVSSVTLDGSASVTATSYLWTKIAGPGTQVITTPTTVGTTVTNLVAGTYIFQLSINGGVSTDQVQVVVNPAPAPTANAGPDQVLTLPINTATLNGSASLGIINSYGWTNISGPNTPTITTPTTVTTTVTGLIVGTYIFQLSLNAGVSTDQVQVLVNNNQPNPTILIRKHKIRRAHIK